jgi:hypothetical protein
MNTRLMEIEQEKIDLELALAKRNGKKLSKN